MIPIRYDSLYSPALLDVVVPSIVIGNADKLGRSLGRLCADLRQVHGYLASSSAGVDGRGATHPSLSAAAAAAEGIVDGAGGGDAPLAGAGAGGSGRATLVGLTEQPSAALVVGGTPAPATPIPEGLSLEDVDVLLTRTSRAVHLLEDCLGVRRGFFFGSDEVSAPLMAAAPAPASLKTLSSMDSTRRLALCEGEGGAGAAIGAPGGSGEWCAAHVASTTAPTLPYHQNYSFVFGARDCHPAPGNACSMCMTP